MPAPPLVLLGDGQTFDPAVECSPEADDIAVIGLREDQISIIRNSTVTHIPSMTGPTAGLAIDGHFAVRIGAEYVSIWEYPSGGYERRVPHQCDVGDDGFVPTRWIANHKIQILFADAIQSWDCKSGQLTDQVGTPDEFNIVAISSASEGEPSIVTLDDSGDELTVWSAVSLSLQSKLQIGKRTLLATTTETALLHEDHSPMLSAVSIRTGEVLCELRGDSQAGLAVFSCDGRNVITSLCDRGQHSGLSVTDVLSGIQTTLEPSHPFRPKVISSKFHRVFATITNDKRHPVDRTSLWNVKGDELLRVSGHTGFGRQAFSPKGKFISVSDRFAAEHCVSGAPAGTMVISDFSSVIGNA